MSFVFVGIGLLIGCAFAWVYLRTRLQAETGKLEERAALIAKNHDDLARQLEEERNRSRSAEVELARLSNDYENLQNHLSEQRKEVEQLQEKFKTEFKNIANELLEDKSRKFTEQNKQNIDEILKPLKDKLKDFESKVENTHKESLEKNAGLIQQIVHLKELNQQMSEEARNLTRALKGDTKTQGSWGEVILESILEK